jgi:hypothetical protein
MNTRLALLCLTRVSFARLAVILRLIPPRCVADTRTNVLVHHLVATPCCRVLCAACSMPPTPAMDSTSPTPGSNTSSMPPTPGDGPATPPEATAADTPAEDTETSATPAAAAAAAAVATDSAGDPAAGGSSSDSSSAVTGAAEAVARLQLSPTGSVEQTQPEQQQQQQRDGGPFAVSGSCSCLTETSHASQLHACR